MSLMAFWRSELRDFLTSDRFFIIKPVHTRYRPQTEFGVGLRMSAGMSLMAFWAKFDMIMLTKPYTLVF